VIFLVAILSLPLAGCGAANAHSIPSVQTVVALEPSATDVPAATLPAPAKIQLPLSRPSPGPQPSATPMPKPLAVALPADLPEKIASTLRTALVQIDGASVGGQVRPVAVVEQTESGDVQAEVVPINAPGETLAERYYAVVVPFTTVRDGISISEIRARWQGKDQSPLYVIEDPAFLQAILGPGSATVITPTALLGTLQSNPKAVGILPFDRLDPQFKVLTVDGVNVLSNRLDAARYPLAGALKLTGEGAETLAPLIADAIAPKTNRAADKLTTLIMTGVTAMSRDTAKRMEEEGVLYPTLVISGTLAAADITHVSNEVPFLDDCEVNATPNNLVLCSDTKYWEALKAIGTDIVGLSGNHVNDFGYDGARRSLQFYRDNKIPIYGSGLNIEEACTPLMGEHNGNTFAFIAALAWWPESAWATDKLPGACYYYDNKDRIKAMVNDLAQKVDVVAVEVQYLETYDPFPTDEQVADFREIRGWGADIVTGVQSHVPQAAEPYGLADQGGPGIIVYGLGNLFFDQMWSWPTRTELYARHTVYDGRLLSTEILTGVLEDFAQPRWASTKERAEILNRIFVAAPKRP
jgi:poly-gamma-glutamate synthesis protein (capsule biosynthesis protein)